MRILLDSCVWGPARLELEEFGHDVVWMGDLGEDPGDEEILSQSVRDGRILVTLDKDFGELAIVFGHPHAGIVRLVGVSARKQGQVVAQIIALHETELVKGAIVTAEPGRLRIRTGW